MRSEIDKEFIISQFSQYGKMVLRIAFQNTGNMTEAEDITQDVFLKLMKEDRNFTDEEHIKAWLIRVTINRCRDFMKSSRFRKNVAFTEENLDSNYFTEDCFSMQDKQIFVELGKLPPKYRNVLYLYYVEEYTVPEIGKLLSAKENTVSSWLRRAKKKLKLRMEGDNSYEQECLYYSNAKN